MWISHKKEKHKNNFAPTTVFEERPSTWIFLGYIVFAYFACPILVLEEDLLVVYTVDSKALDKQKDKDSGRRYYRDKVAGRSTDEDSSLKKGRLRHKNIVALQVENAHGKKHSMKAKTQSNYKHNTIP